MSVVKVAYDLSDAAMRERFIATGEEGKRGQVLEIDCTTLTPEERQVVAEWRNLPYTNGQRLGVYELQYNSLHLEMPTFSALMTVADALGFMRSMVDECPRIHAEEKRIHAEEKRIKAARHAKYKAEQAEKVLLEQIVKETMAKRKVEEDAERDMWIAEHGSDYLKRAVQAGHTCSRRYWTERATIEYPDFVLDFDKDGDWKDRSCPSLASLDLRDELLAAHPEATVKIVWLTAPVRNRTPEEDRDLEGLDFQECEGIIVDDPDYTRMLVREM